MIHGDFLQRPGNHINSKQGCSKCAGNINKSSQEFIEEVIKIHGDIYDYSKVDYKSRHTKIIIICKIHGEFEQEAGNHLCGANCYKCSIITTSEKRKITLQEFIDRSNINIDGFIILFNIVYNIFVYEK